MLRFRLGRHLCDNSFRVSLRQILSGFFFVLPQFLAAQFAECSLDVGDDPLLVVRSQSCPWIISVRRLDVTADSMQEKERNHTFIPKEGIFGTMPGGP
jgi:hypothetical protein